MSMRKLQSQGVHHITLVGADRQTSIDFWEGVLGMPFIFEQPNLDRPSENHLYFDPGDGRLITVFTNEERAPDPERASTDQGCVHHIAFTLSQATFNQAVERLDERGIDHAGVKDRGFMDSIYFSDPLGLLIELASYRFEPPAGFTHADVLLVVLCRVGRLPRFPCRGELQIRLCKANKGFSPSVSCRAGSRRSGRSDKVLIDVCRVMNDKGCGSVCHRVTPSSRPSIASMMAARPATVKVSKKDASGTSTPNSSSTSTSRRTASSE